MHCRNTTNRRKTKSQVNIYRTMWIWIISSQINGYSHSHTISRILNHTVRFWPYMVDRTQKTEYEICKLCMNLLWMKRSQNIQHSIYLLVCLSVEPVKVNEDNNNNNHFVCCYFCLSLIRLFSNNIFLVLLKVFIAVIVLIDW